MKKKRIVAFMDGRPGHEKQTLGIIFALQDRCDVDLQRVLVKKQGLWKTVCDYIALILPFTPECPYATDDAELLIGTGSSTHLPMLRCKKRSGIPAAVCMSPNLLLRSRFDLCFVPEHDGLMENDIIKLTLGAPNIAVNKGGHSEDCGLIAIGGKDEKSHYWDSEGLLEMVRKVITNASGISWNITSSPRTPPETTEGLRLLARQHDNAVFYAFADTEKGWIEEQYARSSYVWVSADSISMIFEALSSGCKVGILPMQWKRKTGKFQRNEASLKAKNLVLPYGDWLAGKAAWPELQYINEAQRCAELVMTLWQNRN